MKIPALKALIIRNIKLFFKDKVSFLMSMVTPLILLVLFVTFLRNVYIESLYNIIGENFSIDKSLVEAFAGSWLLSSILGVTSVTLAFCANTIMVTDKINGAILDFQVSPVSKRLIAISYFVSNFIVTFAICCLTFAVGIIYLALVGWYLSALDILLILVTILLCIIFGTLLAAIVENFLSTQGALSALATLVSSMYGFLCGAYMPISQFSTPIRNLISFLPGTYGVVLLRNHFMNGVMSKMNIPSESLEAIKDGFDNNIYFFGHKVEVAGMYLPLIIANIILFIIFMLLVVKKEPKIKKKAIGEIK